jgi:hypothetical protein
LSAEQECIFINNYLFPLGNRLYLKTLLTLVRSFLNIISSLLLFILSFGSFLSVFFSFLLLMLSAVGKPKLKCYKMLKDALF